MSKTTDKTKYLEHMKNRGRTKTPFQHYDGGFWKSTDGFTSREATVKEILTVQREGESD